MTQPEHKSMEELISYLTFNGTEKLRCPRCGWLEGKAFHCGLCEGHSENVVDWYSSHLNSRNLLERFVDFALPYEGKNTNLAQRAFMICKIDEFIESEEHEQ